MSFTVVIPARFASTRLPGKPLVDIHGQPMIAHVVHRALASGAKRVIVATDHLEILTAAQKAGAESCMTRADHQSGTERITEVIEQYEFKDDEIVVNVQGDEPLIEPSLIDQVANDLSSCEGDMSTVVKDREMGFDPNVVKVVRDVNGYALYFSRAAIPWDRDGVRDQLDAIDGAMLKHVGIYAYRVGFLRKYKKWKPSILERVESLEQLRVLWYGGKIHVTVAPLVVGISIDTDEDLEKIQRLDPSLFAGVPE